jgi:carbonic anhydrase
LLYRAVGHLAATATAAESGAMTHLDALFQRNRSFAATDAKDKVPAIPFIPTMQTYVITCVDPRVDPAAILGLNLGDGIVARCVGGRVTPEVLRDLRWISHLHEVKTPDAEWFELAVIHHTDCGSGLLADEQLRRQFAQRHGYDEETLARLAVVDPAATVRVDVDTLLASAEVNEQIAISGYTYDLHTGLVTEVVPARRRGRG